MRTRVCLTTGLILPVLLAMMLILPVADAQGDACAGLMPPRLTVGGRAEVTIDQGQVINLRDAPERAGGPVAQLRSGDDANVLAGPMCADGYRWWQVESSGLIGWLAEAGSTGYLLTPIRIDAPTPDPADHDCSEVLPPIGQPGEQLEVNFIGQPLQARMLPVSAAGVLSQWWAGSILTIVAGPSCGSGMWWQRVELPNRHTAWIALGDSAQYYVNLANVTPTAGPTLTPTDTPPFPTATSTLTLTPTITLTPSATRTVQPTTTPRATLTLTATFDSACREALPPRLVEGQRGEVAPEAEGLRLRILPSAEAGIVVILNPGNRFGVLDGPSCNGGYWWYRIQTDLGGFSGWVAEGAPDAYWLQPEDYLLTVTPTAQATDRE